MRRTCWQAPIANEPGASGRSSRSPGPTVGHMVIAHGTAGTPGGRPDPPMLMVGSTGRRSFPITTNSNRWWCSRLTARGWFPGPGCPVITSCVSGTPSPGPWSGRRWANSNSRASSSAKRVVEPLSRNRSHRRAWRSRWPACTTMSRAMECRCAARCAGWRRFRPTGSIARTSRCPVVRRSSCSSGSGSFPSCPGCWSPPTSRWV